MTYAETYLMEAVNICRTLDKTEIERMATDLAYLRDVNGRLFIAGLGGSAANASHAANDFRKLCGIEAYCLSDNVAELTARINDEGWHGVYRDTLEASKAKDPDALLILSVGGGTSGVSLPLCYALNHAKQKNMRILGIVGRDGGETKQQGDCVVVVPTPSETRVTPHTEAFQSVVLHLLVSHPKLQLAKTKW